jgi:hypothetical protein
MRLTRVIAYSRFRGISAACDYLNHAAMLNGTVVA